MRAGLANTSMTQVRAILFDAVGTLIRPEPAVAAAYHRAGRRFGSRLTEAELRTRFSRSFARLEAEDATERRNRTDEARERERWQQIVAEVFDDVTEQEGLFRDLWEHFATPENWRLFDDAADCLRRLQQRGDIVLGIASNFDRRLERIVAAFPELSPARHVFVSSQLGFRKPAGGFFSAIEQALKLTPKEILLVGDDEENDYLGAKDAGWQAIIIDRDRKQATPGKLRSLVEMAGNW